MKKWMKVVLALTAIGLSMQFVATLCGNDLFSTVLNPLFIGGFGAELLAAIVGLAHVKV